MAPSGGKECFPENVREKINHVSQQPELWRSSRRRTSEKAFKASYVAPGPALGSNLSPLPTHYLKIEVNEFFVHFALASRQAQIRPGDPDAGRLHVCKASRPADGQTYGQRPTGRGKQTEANRQTLTDTDSLVEGVCSIFPELEQENGL